MKHDFREGDVVRHYKGARYEILSFSQVKGVPSLEGKTLINYKDSSGNVWSRTEENFLENVTPTEKRFTKVKYYLPDLTRQNLRTIISLYLSDFEIKKVYSHREKIRVIVTSLYSDPEEEIKVEDEIVLTHDSIDFVDTVTSKGDNSVYRNYMSEKYGDSYLKDWIL